MKPLTHRQRELLAFIEDYIDQNGYPPSIREMASHMGIRSTNGVNDHLKALERKGFILRNPGSKSRAISLAKPRQASLPKGITSVPIVGQVAAGQPILALENLEGHLNLDRSLLGSDSLFALTVRGDSMIEKGIFDGDVVFVRRQDDAQPNQIVVALIEGEATVKIYKPGPDSIVFVPANRRMKPIVIRKEEATPTCIIGIVMGVFRKLTGF